MGLNAHFSFDVRKVKWDARGLVPVVVQDARDGRVRMLGYMNEEALRRTRETGELHLYSRSRGRLWRKGETSGHVHRVRALRLDCDGDALLALVEAEGPTCHTGSASCFDSDDARAPTPAAPFELIELTEVLGELWRVFEERRRQPRADSYVCRLLDDERLLQRKLIEEAAETALAEDAERLRAEAADLLFHLGVWLFARGVSWADVAEELRARRPQRSRGPGSGSGSGRGRG